MGILNSAANQQKRNGRSVDQGEGQEQTGECQGHSSPAGSHLRADDPGQQGSGESDFQEPRNGCSEGSQVNPPQIGLSGIQSAHSGGIEQGESAQE
jgi:hypothetical protein